VFENRVLRGIFGPKGEEVEQATYYLGDEIEDEMGGACGTH